MAGQIKVNQIQLGDSATATQNFVLQTNVDGTCKLSRGNAGATTQDIFSIDSNGVISFSNMSVNNVRQTVNNGVKNSSGYANMLSVGSGLALNLAATATPMVVSFASGINDRTSILSADVTSVVTGLAANNLSYIKADYVNGSSVTWDKTLAPVQYGYAYNQAAQALLHFDGAAGSTTMLDDYGNSWTAQGGAKLQTNWTKFGTAALGGGGTNNALNGTTDYIKTTGITTLGSGSWAMRAWVNPSSLPTSGNVVSIASLSGAAIYGCTLGILNNAGTIKFAYYLSSTGAAWDIANGTQGTTTPLIGTAYFVELTFDAAAGVYRLYVNGVQESSTTSSTKVCSGTQMSVGTLISGSYFFNGYIDEFEFLPYCDHPAGTTYAVPTQASNVATANYSSDFFSIPDMTMYKVTAASASAATNPTLTPVSRVYVGEAVTGASSVSSVVNYALNGKFTWTQSTLTTGTQYSFNHNIGVKDLISTKFIECKTAEAGYVVGERVYNAEGDDSGTGNNHYGTFHRTTAKTLTVVTGAQGIGVVSSSGANVLLTPANWLAGGNIKRAW